jgi:pathogenesis-related protein 1
MKFPRVHCASINARSFSPKYMKTPPSLAGLALAASLFLTPALFTAQAQQFAGKPTGLPPSVPGGAPITIAVYNYNPYPVTAYWVTPAGVLQPVPGTSPIPPITGLTPTNIQGFRDATLVFKGPNGKGGGKHFGGNAPAPFMVCGTPPPGVNPPGRKGGTGSALTGTTPAAPAAPGNPGTTVNKSVVNKSVTNNPPPAAPETPAAPGKGRKRVVKKAGDVNVINNPPPSDAPAAPSADTPAPASPTEPSPTSAKNGEPEGELKMLTAEDPRVVEFLRIHNAARADVGVSPLEWSEDLAFTAQDWADRIGRTGKIEHRPESAYGENIGWGTGDYTPASAANRWLAEKAKYSPDAAPKPAGKKKGKAAAKADPGAESAHYTQMVWGKSTMVGFGLATTKDGKTVVVANYNPRGNIAGEKPFEK